MILEINREEFDCTGQMVERIVKMVLKIILFNSCFLQHLFSKIDTHNHSQLLKWKYHSFLKIMILTFLLLAKHGLKSKFKLTISNYTITRNDRPRRQGGVTIVMCNSIKLGVVDTGFSLDDDNEAFTIILKNSQLSTNISNTYIPPASPMNTTTKNSVDNVTITGDLKAKHTDFHCSMGYCIEKSFI